MGEDRASSPGINAESSRSVLVKCLHSCEHPAAVMSQACLAFDTETWSAIVSKFRIRLKLQGLELEIDGSREDASLINQNIGQQVASLMQPIGGIIEGEIAANGLASSEAAVVPANGSVKANRRRKRSSPGPNPDGQSSSVIEFQHSPEKFGFPKQTWKTAAKMLWLLYVIKETTGRDEVTNANLVSTFNQHFKQAGTVRHSNSSRDLGHLKIKEKPALVGEHAGKSPPTWFLTEEGNRRAQRLVAEALGQSEQLL